MNRQAWQQLILPAGIVGAILVVLMPLPPMVIDVLLIANITLAVIVLLTTLNIKTPLEFSIFPSLLLAATLGRLVLNIATTRLILTNGHAGVDSAGGVVQGFGQFVSAGNLVVGGIIFLILIVVQFVVITKGSTRISEVAARFMLDALPGRQMAIDAQLNAGAIDREVAQQQRQALDEQSDFYGAMDGASKFVRGDAIAAMIITGINIVGGLIIGVWYGMSVPEAAATFTTLTIGDGLASQLPAFLIALAAGLLVTRSNRESDLSFDFLNQLVAKPQVLVVAGVFVIALLFTKLPLFPVLVIGSCCFGIAFVAGRSAEEEPVVDEQVDDPEPGKTVRIEDYLTVDPLEIEIGVELVALADPTVGGDLLDRINRVRQTVASDLGIILPKVRIRDNLNLESNQYRVRIFNSPVAHGSLQMGRLMALSDSVDVIRELDGDEAFDPGTGRNAKWLDVEERDGAVSQGCAILSPAGVLAKHLASVCRRNAHLILTREATQHLVNEVQKRNPTVVQELIPEQLRLADVQAVLQSLLQENVSIRQLGMILETLGNAHPEERSRHQLVEHVRKRLGPHLCAKYVDEESNLNAIRLSADLETYLVDAYDWQIQSVKSQVPASDVEMALEQIEIETEHLTDNGIAPVLLVGPVLRPVIRALLADRMPGLVILSTSELMPNVNVNQLAKVELTASGFSEAC